MAPNPLSSQTIFADDTYSKPYLITYINSFFFALLLPFDLLKRLGGKAWSTWRCTKQPTSAVGYAPLAEAEEDDQALSKPVDEGEAAAASRRSSGRQSAPDRRSSNSERLGESSAIVPEQVLDIRQTAKLGFEFCVLWVQIPPIHDKN